MFPKLKHVLIDVLPTSNIHGMLFSHNKPLYLFCATTPLEKVHSPTFHRLTNNNTTRSTKPSVRALLLSSCQRLMVERNPFTLTQQSPLGKRTILTLQLSKTSYCHITYVHIYISSHRKVNHTSTHHIITSYHNLSIISLHLKILTYNSHKFYTK